MTGTCTAVGIFLEYAISTKKKLRKYFTDFIMQTMYPRVHHSFHFDFVLGRKQKLELRVPPSLYFFACTYHVGAWVGLEEQQP